MTAYLRREARAALLAAIQAKQDETRAGLLKAINHREDCKNGVAAAGEALLRCQDRKAVLTAWDSLSDARKVLVEAETALAAAREDFRRENETGARPAFDFTR
jgi:hypothetical protein